MSLCKDCACAVKTSYCLALCSSFPVGGFDFITGNDIAREKVNPVLKVVDVPISVYEPDFLAQKHVDVFSVSVLTRAQGCKKGHDV